MEGDTQTVIRKICELNSKELFNVLEGFLSPEDLQLTRMNSQISAAVDIGTHRSQELRSAVCHEVSDQAAEFIQLVPVKERKETVWIDFLSLKEIGSKVGEDFHRLRATPDTLRRAIKQIGNMPSTEALLQMLRQRKIPKNVRRVIFPTKELADSNYLCFFVAEQRKDGYRLKVATDGTAWGPEIYVAVILENSTAVAKESPGDEQEWFSAESLIH